MKCFECICMDNRLLFSHFDVKKLRAGRLLYSNTFLELDSPVGTREACIQTARRIEYEKNSIMSC
jgi:hypothetical protein